MKALSAVVLGLLVLGSAGSTAAQDDNAKKIVGKWEITKSEGGVPSGAVIEFTKDGKLLVTAMVEGTELKLDGSYKVEKDKLLTKIKIGDKTHEDTDTITKLNDQVLEIKDKDNKITALKRKK